MKIVAQGVDVAGADTGSPITLGEDLAGDLIDPPPLRGEQRLVNAQPLYGAATPYTNDQGNRRNSYTWTVAREHASWDAAVTFSLTHANDVPGNARLTITHGAITVAQSIGAFTAIECVELTGKSTKFRYSFTGGTLASV